MKRIAALICIVALAGCAHPLPKPNNPQTAGVEALVAYGLAAHVAGQYLALPTCTQPLTTVPCKTQALADKVKEADTTAYNAAIAADKAVNDPAVAQNAAVKLENLKQANAEAAKGNKQP